MKITISPEMIEAGQRALAGPLKTGKITRRELCALWRAMAGACPSIEVPIPEGATPRAIVIRLS